MADIRKEGISPQGYQYEDDPKSTHPFWDALDWESGLSDGKTVVGITATAEVDDTTGTPAVTVTQSGDDNEIINFSFTGLKGEKGADGAAGVQGAEGPQGPQGEAGKDAMSYYQNFARDFSIGQSMQTMLNSMTAGTFCTASYFESFTMADTDGHTATFVTRVPVIIYKTATQCTVYVPTLSGASSALGATYLVSGSVVNMPDITATISLSRRVSCNVDGITFTAGTILIQPPALNNFDISITNENGVYTVQKVVNGVMSDVGTIEVPEIDTSNVLAEIADSVVETTEGNYQNDFHTFKETEYNGTQNEVGKFYIARSQITSIIKTTGNNIFSAIRTYKIEQDGTTDFNDITLLRVLTQQHQFNLTTDGVTIDTTKKYIATVTLGRSDSSQIFKKRVLLTHIDSQFSGSGTIVWVVGNNIFITGIIVVINDGSDFMTVTTYTITSLSYGVTISSYTLEAIS